MRLPALAAVVATALVLPGEALAGTVSRTDATITYTADPAATAAEAIVLGTENGRAFVQSALGVTSPDCTPADPNRVDCAPAGAFVVNVLGFDDSVSGELVTIGAGLEAHGGAGGDTLTGTPNADRLFGEAGGDTLAGLGGNDLLDGGPGDNSFSDGPGDDTVIGGPGNDTWFAGPGRDVFTGGDGVDRADYRDRTAGVTATLDGRPDDGEAGEGDNVGADVESVLGGAGPDRLVAGPVGAELEGGPGNDILTGGPGEDRLVGDEGDDVIDARDGHFDSVDCGPGVDTLLADPGDTGDNCEIAPDRDGDGFPNEQDCQPDNPLVNPNAAEIYGNAVDEDCKDGPAYFTVSAAFNYTVVPRRHPDRIRWTSFKLTGLRRADRVDVRCRNRHKGCAFTHKARTVTSRRTTLSMLKAFKRRFLRVGAVVEVRIERENQHTRYYRLRIARGPKVKRTLGCILVGTTKPAACPPPA